MNGSEGPAFDAVGLVIEALPAAVALVDPTGTVLLANDRFAGSIGDGTPQSLADLIDEPSRLRSALELWFGSSAPRPATLNLDGQTFRCDGARLGTHDVALVQFVTRTEAVEAFTATSRAVDLDRLARTEQRLRSALAEIKASNAALRASNEELERFASIVSHDLQSPLLVIRGMASMLLEQLTTSDDRELAEAVVRNAEKMQTQISGILEVARAGTGSAPERPLELMDALEEVRALLASELQADGAVLEVRQDLPAVMLTRSEGVQLLQNLIHNALKFAGGDEGPARIEVSGERLDGHVQVAVEDDGPGVPPERRESVFDLFDRGAQTHVGTGIGLATCRRIVERRGGRIWIDDSHLGGAAVRFTLPAVSAGSDQQGL